MVLVLVLMSPHLEENQQMEKYTSTLSPTKYYIAIVCTCMFVFFCVTTERKQRLLQVVVVSSCLKQNWRYIYYTLSCKYKHTNKEQCIGDANSILIHVYTFIVRVYPLTNRPSKRELTIPWQGCGYVYKHCYCIFVWATSM